MDVTTHLDKAGALLDTPRNQPRRMNPLSIELYRRYQFDLSRHPLGFAINKQHMKGAVAAVLRANAPGRDL